MSIDIDRDARVLIADDEPFNIAMLTRFLGRAGYEHIEAVSDSRDVVSRVLAFDPDIVLLDLHMPPPDGLEVLRQLMNLATDTYLPVIVLTADVDDQVKQRALSLGAADFLTKPFSITETLLRVRNLILIRRQYQVLARHTLQLAAEVESHHEIDLAVRERRERVVALVEDVAQRLTMVCQPIVDLASGEIAGAEALARFKTVPYRPPNEWFADAAENGLGVQLEIAAARTALAEADQLPPDAFLAINLSPTTLGSPELAELLGEGTARSVVIELTEHHRVDDYDQLTDDMDALRGRGVRFAVDDAGSGFAGLNHILRVRPDFIKLDLVLVRDVDCDPAKRSLADALVRFAAETGATLIAEGIETRAEFDTLRALGVEFGQGYSIGLPRRLPLELVPPVAAA